MISSLQFDLPILLPETTAAVGPRVDALRSETAAIPGVREVRIVTEGDDRLLQLDHDPMIVPAAQLRILVVEAATAVNARYGHLSGAAYGVRDARHAQAIQSILLGRSGVVFATISTEAGLHVEFERHRISASVIRLILAEEGVRLKTAMAGVREEESSSPSSATSSLTPPRGTDPVGHDHAGGGSHDHDHGTILGPNSELIFALLCGGLLGLGFGLEKLVPAAPSWLPLSLFVAAYGFGGFFTVREAIENLRARRFEIDTLMLVAAAGAAALGAWAEGALLLFLFSIGHALENYAMGRAKRAIEALAELAPRTARRKRGEVVEEVPVEDLEVGDRVVVRPNERLPADGFVAIGTTSIDQAPVTGESMPVDKEAVADAQAARARPQAVGAASVVFAGTINGAGAIEIETTRASSDTTLAKVVRMVSEAETQKSPTQRFTDRFERIFVPVVLLLAFVLLFAWVVVDEPFRDSFYRAMAVLVAASPCALAIATPSAVLSGVARAARAGVLIKGGGPLENLGSLTALAFDKTGTLTEGRPRITDVVPAPGVVELDLLAVATAVERLSDHPLAEAIARDGAARLSDVVLPRAEALTSLTGMGVRAEVDGQPVWIGKPDLFGRGGVAPLSQEVQLAVRELRETGRTLMVIRQGDRDLGVIGLLDTPRPAAAATLAALKALGVQRMIMISGDHQKAAEAIAAQVGLTEAWGDLLPEDKVAAIKKLQAETKVAMVGDGVNDAPAMATATVGVAMGAAGSDVALETADVALMGDDLSKLPFTVGLSRRTRAVIRQNLFVSLGVVAFLVPATLFGLGIGPAVALHEGSTLFVVVNALRLLAYREPRA